MRLAIPSRSGRLPRPTVVSALELALLALVAVQAARLAWTLATPLTPVGDWQASGGLAPAGDAAALAEFDPFFRLSGGGGPGLVTALNLKLHGVREDRATGRGSAIIALPDGTQRSFVVGEEILPGVTLAEVGFDSVTISRGGALEQIFLDQSEPAPAAPDAAGEVPPAPPPAPTPRIEVPTVTAPASVPPPPIQLQPRTNGARVDGLIVGPGADGGQAFRAAGFAPGDVIVAVNGQRVTSLAQAQALLRQSGGQANVIVDRGGRAVPLRIRLNP